MKIQLTLDNEGNKVDPAESTRAVELEIDDEGNVIESIWYKRVEQSDEKGFLTTLYNGLKGLADTIKSRKKVWPPEDEGEKGGPGSGNWGHAGRPGERGGSAPGGGHGVYNLRALQPFHVRQEDKAIFNRVMRLDSPEAKAMLKRVGVSKGRALELIQEARARQQVELQTKERHAPGGEYSSERQSLHDEIVDDIVGQGKVSDDPSILLTGGYPGSGKSSMLRSDKYDDVKTGYVRIDSDNIKKRLGTADGIDKLGWRAQSYHEEADDIIAKVFRRAVEDRRNIIFDGTMKNGAKVERIIGDFRKLGYRIEIAFAKLPMEKAMTRAISRFLEGGRFVDPAYIASHNHRNILSVESLRSMSDEWRIWNTDVPFGATAELEEEVIQ
jgi:predicted ABC-type ATPase